MDWTKYREEKMGGKSGSVLPPTIKLPTLPQALMLFSKRCADPESSPKELGAIVETDAGLTCDLLKHINSSTYGMRRKISSAQQAISLLGIPTTKLLLTMTAVKNAMSTRDSKLINLKSFWNLNIERALFARKVAKLLGADQDLAYAGGMLQDFILPVLTSEMCDTYIDFTTNQETTPVNMVQYENSCHQWDHALAAAHIMVDWEFSDDLVCCILMHHTGLHILKDPVFRKTSVAAVAVSALMPDTLRQVPNGLEQLQLLDEVWSDFNLLDIATEVTEEYQEATDTSGGNHITFLRHCERALKAETANA